MHSLRYTTNSIVYGVNISFLGPQKIEVEINGEEENAIGF
jgi:hypothetical protein